jgi:peroxiredoxin
MLMTRKAFSLVAAASAVVALSAAALIAAPASASIATGAKAPAFSEIDTTGKTRTLSEFAGKTVVLEWTNHQCPFVVKHYQTGNMQKLQADAGKSGVVWLRVISSAPGKQGHFDAAGATAQAKTDKVPANVVTLLDADGSMGKAFGARTTPHMYVIDAKGAVVYQGAIDDNPGRGAETVAKANNYVTVALASLKAGQPIAKGTTQPYGCTIKY